MIFLKLAKSALRRWLETRALVLPTATRNKIAERTGVSLEMLTVIEAEIRASILAEVDKI